MSVRPWLVVCSALMLVAGCGDDGPRRVVNDANWSAPLVDRTADFQFTAWSAESFNATDLAFLPDGRALITTKGDFDDGGNGRLVLVNPDGQTARQLLEIPVCAENERGLGGVAVHPNFPEDPRVFLYYTALSKGCEVSEWGTITPGELTGVENRLSSFELVGDAIDPASEVVLLDGLEAGASIHNGGGLDFLPDGSLLVAVGEAGLGAASADLDQPTGKVLRLDVSAPHTGWPDNPYYEPDTPTSVRSLVYASGFRNPFRIAVDHTTGAVGLTDVGTSVYEEVNLVTPGLDYGYPYVEGPESLDGSAPPAVWYDHASGCVAVIGAAWLPSGFIDERDTADFAFGDFLCGQIRAARFENGQLVELATITRSMGEIATTGLTAGPDGALYVATRPGPVYRVVPKP